MIAALFFYLFSAVAVAEPLPVATVSRPTPILFESDVLPVLQAKCQGCHRPGEVAPMSFLTYSSTRPWAKAIRAAVNAKVMPPWFAVGRAHSRGAAPLSYRLHLPRRCRLGRRCIC